MTWLLIEVFAGIVTVRLLVALATAVNRRRS
jgi:hypothetical protein